MEVNKVPIELQTWMKSKSEEMSSKPLSGYFPADTVVDAFQKGQEHAEGKFRKNIRTKVSAMYDSVYECINLLKPSYPIYELYMFFNFSGAKAILLIDEENHLSPDFIDKIYPEVSKIEIAYKQNNNMALDISFLDDFENVDRSQLKNDGFFGYNLKTSERIFQ